LQQFAGQPIRVFVVWEPVLVTDWTRPSTATLKRIYDSRASQYWDKDRLISGFLGGKGGRSVVWDYVAVYAPGTVWRGQPPQPAYQGGPVVRVTDSVKAALKQVLQGVAQPH
jgi:hypothetical protein